MAPEGQRFVMIREEGAEMVPRHINLVLDWLEELKARARQRGK